MPAPDNDAARPALDTIQRPGAIKINVQGAFIVDDGDSSPPNLSPARSRAFEDEDYAYEHDTNDIRLPNHTTIVSHVAVDIGGSLAKLVYFSQELSAPARGGRLNFLKFETDRIESCIAFMKSLQQKQKLQINGSSTAAASTSRPSSSSNAAAPQMSIIATGGGAFKYYDDIRTALDVPVHREDEMECLIIGLDFFISEIPSEVFTHDEGEPMHFLPPRTGADVYPYLLVNIGSGVSMIKVSGPRKFQRIGGTSLGGGTLWGLLSLITGARSFDDMLAMADRGDNTAVDMLVGDIYGTGYGKIGLKSTTIASSFGKVYKMKREAEREAEDGGGLSNGDPIPEGNEADSNSYENGTTPPSSSSSSALPSSNPPTNPSAPATDAPHRTTSDPARPFKPEDVSRSLLYAVSYNIGQIAYLQSCKHGLEHIYFGGSFIRGHRQTMNTLAFAIRYWSSGEKQAYFLRHEGYLGAVGAFLMRQPRNWGRKNSFEELPSVGGVLRGKRKEGEDEACEVDGE